MPSSASSTDRPSRGLVIAIDGPSGSGKSSTSRGVASRLGLRYLDTGAMYRAMTWWMLRSGVDIHDPEAVAARADDARITSGTDPLAPTIHVDGTDVGVAIRGEDVTGAVSPVSAVPAVRARLLQLQRQAIAEATAEGGIVVEGRDIGSVVAPDAPVKAYLTADPGARAARRALEEGGSDVAATEASLLARDTIDSRRAVVAAGDGRRCRPHRHHPLQPGRGDRPGGRARRGGGGNRVTLSSHHDLPRSAAVAHPRRLMLHGLRPPARFLARRRFQVRVHGAEHTPRDGPGHLREQPHRRRRRSVVGDLRARDRCTR